MTVQFFVRIYIVRNVVQILLKSKKEKDNPSTGIVLFVEGETDKQFYSSLIQYFKELYNEKEVVDKIHIINLKGIGNHASKGPNKFKNEIKRDNPDVEYIVFCAYDLDVFSNQYGIKPPVDWKAVEKTLKKHGAKKVFHLRADQTIEDWFLIDIKGLCDFLKLGNYQPKGSTGLEKIKELFKKKNKIYQKGSYTERFIPGLNMKLIHSRLSSILKPLETYLFKN